MHTMKTESSFASIVYQKKTAYYTNILVWDAVILCCHVLSEANIEKLISTIKKKSYALVKHTYTN